MRRWLFGVLAVVTLLALGLASATAAQNIRILVNGKEIVSDVPPQVVKGRALVPLRVISEALGADVSWGDTSNTVTVTTSEVIDSNVRRFSAKSRVMQTLLLELADLMEKNPIIIQDVLQKYSQSQQFGQPLESGVSGQSVPYPQGTDYLSSAVKESYLQKVRDEANTIRVKIRAAAETERAKIRETAQASRASFKNQFEGAKAQIENWYQTQKMALDREKEELIRQWDEYFNSRGILQSGIRDQKIQEIEAYYSSLYRALEEQRRTKLEELYNTETMINTWEQDALRQIDAWEDEQTQKVDQWEREALNNLGKLG
ncbi:MAG: stalk domain-containing protein [Bacillota bacterium]